MIQGEEQHDNQDFFVLFISEFKLLHKFFIIIFTLKEPLPI